MNNVVKINTSEITQFEIIKKDISDLSNRCKRVVVKDDEALQYAIELTKEANSIEKWIEETRKKITKPILDKKREIDGFAKNLTAELKEAIKEIRTNILEYQKEKEKPKNIRKIWTFEIVDKSKIPLEYLKIDERAIKNDIRKGVREIAGVKIYQKQELVIR